MSVTAFQRRRREVAKQDKAAKPAQSEEGDGLYQDLSRAELNDLAAEKGVEEPEKIGKKADVIEAIRAAE